MGSISTFMELFSFKARTHLIFASATCPAASGTGADIKITTDGASKGITSIKESADGVFDVVLDRGYKLYLGSPSISFQGTGALNAPCIVVTAANPAAGTFTFRTQVVGGTTGVRPTSGLRLNLTLFATDSNVF